MDINANIITSYENHEQDFFDVAFTSKDLINEESIIKNILNHLRQLNHKEGLRKISMCWECLQEDINNFPAIQESIDKNAKYYF